MHSTQNPVVYGRPVDKQLTSGEIEIAKARLGADQREVDVNILTGHLQAIFFLLALEPVGQQAWELIREAQADIAAFNALMDERIARWIYDRDDVSEQTTLGLDDVDGHALGRAVKPSC